MVTEIGGGNMETKNKKFWVIIGEELHLFTDKNEAMTEMRTVLAEDPETSLAEFTYDEKDKKFNIDPVSWKEISQQLAKLLAGIEK